MIKIPNSAGWFFPVEDLRATNVREWYMSNYPTDDLGPKIRADISMWDVVGLLNAGLGHRIYDFLHVGDSIVRERIFGRIAKLVGCDYDDVYYTWLREEDAA